MDTTLLSFEHWRKYIKYVQHWKISVFSMKRKRIHCRAIQTKKACLSIIGTETAGEGKVPQPCHFWVQYFTWVSSISHLHVNQHRQADPQNVYVLRFPALVHCSGRTLCCCTRRDDLCGMKTFPLWLAHLRKGMSRMWGVWYRQPFKRVFFTRLLEEQ